MSRILCISQVVRSLVQQILSWLPCHDQGRGPSDRGKPGCPIGTKVFWLSWQCCRVQEWDRWARLQRGCLRSRARVTGSQSGPAAGAHGALSWGTSVGRLSSDRARQRQTALLQCQRDAQLVCLVALVQPKHCIAGIVRVLKRVWSHPHRHVHFGRPSCSGRF